MALDLPKPQRGHLPRSPLSLVACQVRHDDLSTENAAPRLAIIREELAAQGFAYARAEKVQVASLSIEIGNVSPSRVSPPTQFGWRLITDDNRWIVTIMPDSIALETTRYVAWSGDFKERFAALVAVATKHNKPNVETRLGLRYVDLFTEPVAKSAPDWKPYFNASFLGPILHPVLGSEVTATQQQVNLQVDPVVRSVIRHGSFADPARNGAYTYLMDTDIFREDLQTFDVKSIVKMIERFHTISLQLFQQVITPKMLALLRQKV